MNKFVISRNNSTIVPKTGQKIIAHLTPDEKIYIKLSSKYVPQVDGEVINVKLNHLQNLDYGCSGNYCSLSFIYQNRHYYISFRGDSRKPQVMGGIKNMMLKNKKPMNYKLSAADSRDYTPDHHYGELVAMSPVRVRRLKPGHKYYLVWGQHWDRDYEGKHSIAVLEYEGMKNGELEGTIRAVNYDIEANLIRDTGGIYGSGSGDDPIHFVKQWRKGFKPPAKLPKAELFK